MNLSNRHSLTTMLLITQEQNTQQDAIADLFIFLIRYSFLFFNEPSSGEEILKRDFPYHGKLSSQNPNGARYLVLHCSFGIMRKIFIVHDFSCSASLKLL